VPSLLRKLLSSKNPPATKAIPKEMIPIIDIPMIQHIVEEAVRSGIEEIVLITARHKEAIENHFDYAYEVEHTLDKKGNKELAELSRSIANFCNLICIRQKNPLGLGHAVLCAEPIIGNEPFAVLLGDDLIDSNVPCTKQLIEVFSKVGGSVVGVMEVPTTEVSKYGIVGGKMRDSKLMEVTHLMEKPSPDQAPSRLAIPGRYILDPSIFGHLRKVKPSGKNLEIQLTDGLDLMAKNGNLFAYQFDGNRYDTGDRLGFIDATLAFALKRPDLKAGVRALMEKHLKG
jgi:UTP--glucose-1-phosphate uridylyltransferase